MTLEVSKADSPLASLAVRSAVAGILLLFAVQALHFWSFTVDDVFISMRYAENLVAGEGLVFNPGERVEGYSNLSFTLLLALGNALGVHSLVWAKLLSFLSGIATLVLILNWPVGALRVRLLGGLLLAANTGFALWSTNGMETVFFTFLLTLATFLFIRDIENQGGLWRSGMVYGLAAVTRPEGVMYVCPALAVAWFFARSWKRSIPLLLSFSLPVISQLAFRQIYYGALLPLTFHAKVAPSLEGFLEAIRYYLLPFLYYFITPIGLFFLLPWKEGRSESKKTVCYLLLGGNTALGFFFCIYAHGDWAPAFRFLIPILPGLFWLVTDGLERFIRLAERKNPNLLSRRAVGAGAALMAISIFTHSWGKTSDQTPVFEFESWWKTRSLNWEDWTQPSRLATARWIKEHSRPEELLATGEAGIVPWMSGLRLLDTWGLMTPAITELVESPEEQMVQYKATGNDHPIAVYVEKMRPDLLYTDTWEVPPPVPQSLFDGQYELVFQTGDLWLVYRRTGL